jgi:hypothetical protein
VYKALSYTGILIIPHTYRGKHEQCAAAAWYIYMSSKRETNKKKMYFLKKNEQCADGWLVYMCVLIFGVYMCPHTAVAGTILTNDISYIHIAVLIGRRALCMHIYV